MIQPMKVEKPVKHKVDSPSGTLKTPLHFLITAIVLIFLAETLVMIVLHITLPELSMYKEVFVDSIILSVIAIPALYLLLFRPMASYIKKRDLAEEGLMQAHEVLEERVEERTRELSREITERLRAEEALQKSEASLRKAQEVAHLGGWRLDIGKNELVWSDEVYRIFELHKGTPMTYEKFMELVHPEDRAYVDMKWTAALEGAPYDIEHRIIVGGKVRWVREKAELIFDKSANPVSGVGIAQDITYRKDAKKALKESEQRLAAILDNTTAVIYMKDIEGRYILINRRYETLFHISKDEIIGKSDYEIFSKELADEFRANDMKVIEKRHPVEFDEQAPHDDGLHEYISIKFPIFDSEGGVYAVCGVSTDITDRKRLEEELVKGQKLESIGILAGGIAHDFNNLMTGVIGNLSLVQSEVDMDGPVFKRLIEIEKAAVLAQELTQQLLTFSKGGEPVKETLAVGQLIQESAFFALRGSIVSLDSHMPEDLWLADVDAGQIAQVVNNLVINAAQAMENGGYLKVIAENCIVTGDDNLPLKEGRYVAISFNDQGDGIPEDILPRIFDPYFTTKKKGSGLGLATSYSIIKKHGGHIGVSSEQGAGTNFVVYLPASKKAAAVKKDRTEKPPASAGGRVLVMDDEEIVQDVATSILTSLGYWVTIAAEGGEAVRLYKEAKKKGAPFDAVILDLTVPGGIGGGEAVKELLQLDPRARVLVSSGYSYDPIMANYREYGFSGVIQKPYRVAELGAKVHEVITCVE